MELTVENGRMSLDEIQSFLNARYVSAPEAFWRLAEYLMNYLSHTIVRLAVHLPFQQPVRFEPGSEEEALRRASEHDTTLTAWFKLNQEEFTARSLLYQDVPLHYIFESHKWRKRKIPSSNIIPRIYNVSPTSDNERYCLRLLLLHTAGSTSFDDLKRVNSTTHSTFKEAAKARGLLESDSHLLETMEEAIIFRMPQQLRELFSTICLW